MKVTEMKRNNLIEGTNSGMSSWKADTHISYFVVSQIQAALTNASCYITLFGILCS